jgi:hypothetical protein
MSNMRQVGIALAMYHPSAGPQHSQRPGPQSILYEQYAPGGHSSGDVSK